MKIRDELKEIDIKNRTCYYFDDKMAVGDTDSGNTLLGKKLYKIILIYGISYKTFMGSEPLRFCVDKIDGFIKIYDGIKCLELFGHSWNDEICDRIKYLISRKSGITDTINHTLQESELIHFILYLLKKY